KFQEWQSRVRDQGWSKNEAKALLEFSRDKKSIWSSFEQADRERQHKIQDTSKEPTKVTKTKTLFPTTTTHSY
ncbi:MAG: hypothetical protein NTV12_06960, partial [Verrucomicrobia bacterium]|nr:hypothetical protein [Verrucomicrobiota bacterium]